jgi:hypothetical protein
LGNKKSKRLGDRFPTELDAYNFQQEWISVNGQFLSGTEANRDASLPE